MYYNENTIIYFDGTFIKASDARANPFDQSLHYGYAVFEGIRSYDTNNGVKIFKAAEHFDRMKYSCAAVGIPYPFDNNQLTGITYELLRKNDLANAYIRPLVSCPPNMALTKAKGAQLMIAVWEWGAYLGDQLLRVKTSQYRRIHPQSFNVNAKVSGHYVNSILATQEAKDAGFDEALLLDNDGFVAEGPGANIFIEKDGLLLTPKTGSILPGITRATVIEICKDLGIQVVEKEITPHELATADNAFFCGTAAEVIGIESVDDFVFKKTWEQSLGAVIQGSYRKLVREENYSSILHVA